MPYTPTTWVNNTTPLNATNLNNIEQGVDEAHAHAEASHAPSDAENNANILKSEVEAVLTGPINTHIHHEVRYGTEATPPASGWEQGSPRTGDIWVQHA